MGLNAFATRCKACSNWAQPRRSPGGTLKLSRETKSVVLIGAAAIVIVVALDLLMPTNWSVRLRELGFDQVLAADSLVHRSQNGHSHAQVIVVDIDRRSLEAIGPGPGRTQPSPSSSPQSRAAKPAVVALDILFAEEDSRSPAALARQLGMLQTARIFWLSLTRCLMAINFSQALDEKHRWYLDLCSTRKDGDHSHTLQSWCAINLGSIRYGKLPVRWRRLPN